MSIVHLAYNGIQPEASLENLVTLASEGSVGSLGRSKEWGALNPGQGLGRGRACTVA